MRTNMLTIASVLIALIALNGCAATGHRYGHPATTPYVSGSVNPSGFHADVNFRQELFLANRSAPKLEYQNQAGGWEPIEHRGWIDLPYNQGGLNFRITPNGHFESFEASIDGVSIGGGSNLNFGFGTGTKDGGKHLLVVTVRRVFDPRLGDNVPEHIVETKTFDIIIFYKSTW